MRLLISAALLVLTVSVPALAGPVTIDFEGPDSFIWIDQYYNGGTDGNGNAGPNLGVSFGLDAMGLKNDDFFTYFSNAPSPIGVMAMTGVETTMNVEQGFTDFSFYYSTPEDVLAGVKVWSGLNGTGTVLASFDLLQNFTLGVDDQYSVWTQLSSGPLAGVAQSVTFEYQGGVAGFDQFRLTELPEPGSMVLLGSGLLGLIAVRRRR